MKEWREILLRQERLHPAMELRDFLKLAHQAEFGAEHAFAGMAEAETRVQEERRGLSPQGERGAEPIGSGLCRLHLRGTEEMGLSAATIAGMFRCTAEAQRGTSSGMEKRLSVLLDCCRSGLLPLAAGEAERGIRRYLEDGCPALHHSPAYREAYHPAYRVVEREMGRYLEVFAAIDRKMAEGQRLTVAIDGRSGAGKSTLGGLLAKVYRCSLFHMDDFFLRPEQRTAQRLAQPGGNVDRERFAEEVLAGIRGGRPFCYRRFDCSRMALGPEIVAEPGQLNIVEGSYSLHPDLAGDYGLKIFLDISPQEQSRRILARNGPEMYRRFAGEWIPLENQYFRELRIRQSCHLVLETEEQSEA